MKKKKIFERCQEIPPEVNRDHIIRKLDFEESKRKFLTFIHPVLKYKVNEGGFSTNEWRFILQLKYSSINKF